MINKRIETVLVLAPHTDDGELGLGGTIAKLREEDITVIYAAFSVTDEPMKYGFPKGILEKEMRKAVKILGLNDPHIRIYAFPIREFTYHRQKILDELIVLRNELNPDLVFVPATHDIHQDHQALAHEAIRAFKRTRLLMYEEPWNNLTFSTDCFSILQKSHVQKKIEALYCYESQKYRDYLNEETIWYQVGIRGLQIGEKYAEVFEIARWKI